MVGAGRGRPRRLGRRERPHAAAVRGREGGERRRRLGARDQVPGVGSLPAHGHRPDGRPPRREDRLHRLAGLGRARAEGGRRRGEHPRLRGRQAGVRARGDGDPRDPHPAQGARPREPRVGLAGPAHRVDRGEGGRDAVHLHRHGGDGAQRLRARDAAPAPRADRQRPADPALRRRPGQGGEPADAPPARPRGPGGPAAGDDVHAERARGDRPAHGLHAGGGGRGAPRPDPLRDAQPVGPLLRPRGAGGAHLGPLRRGGRRLRRGDGADARDRRRRGGRLRQGPPRQPLPAHGPLPRALPPRGEGPRARTRSRSRSTWARCA